MSRDIFGRAQISESIAQINAMLASEKTDLCHEEETLHHTPEGLGGVCWGPHAPSASKFSCHHKIAPARLVRLLHPVGWAQEAVVVVVVE